MGDQLTVVAAGHKKITVFSKKLILIYLLVVYCVLFDENESIKSKSSVEDRKTSEKVIYYVNLLQLKFYFNNVKESRKKKGKQRELRNLKKKGRTILILTLHKFVRYKQASLRQRNYENKQFGKLIDKII